MTPDLETPVVDAMARQEANRLHKWQSRLLPLIVRILLGVTVFFFLVSLAETIYLHQRIAAGPTMDLREPFALLRSSPTDPIDERRASAELMIQALLESNAMQRRYHQANVILMARVWTSYLGFVTGMALALVGAAFILGRIQGTETKVSTKLGAMSADLATALPGIVLVFLGVALMITTLFVKYTISVADASVYLGSHAHGRATSESAPPKFTLPQDLDEQATPD